MRNEKRDILNLMLTRDNIKEVRSVNKYKGQSTARAINEDKLASVCLNLDMFKI